MKLLFLSLAVFLSATDPFWSTDFKAAKQEATHSGKWILINFSGSDWCIPCIRMEKEIFKATSFSEYASKNLVLVKADFPRLKKNKLSPEQAALNEELAGVYNPHGKFPFTILLDKEGKVLKSWDGLPSREAEQFVAEINAATHGGN